MYYIIEIQKTDDNTSSCLVHNANDGLHGESVYHQILSYAAISSIPYHSVILIDDKCNPIYQKTYKHIDSNEVIEEEDTQNP